MANEINIRLDTSGLNVTAKVLSASGAQQGSNVTLTETNKYYTGTYSWAGLPDGRYLVEFTRNDTDRLVGLGEVEIKDGAELTNPLLQTNLVAEHDATQATLSTLSADVADAVWDESYADHTTAGTFGKLIDILKKSNTNFDGTVTANATASSFDTDLADPTGTHDHQLLLFTTGNLAGQSKPILTFTNGAGNTCIFEEAFTEAPQIGDEFVIIVSHIHPVSEIQAGLATIANQAIINAGVKNASLIIPHTTDLP